ncbi:hypothetical protein Tco_0501969 [Tanacetum coccineum]
MVTVLNCSSQGMENLMKQRNMRGDLCPKELESLKLLSPREGPPLAQTQYLQWQVYEPVQLSSKGHLMMERVMVQQVMDGETLSPNDP